MSEKEKSRNTRRDNLVQVHLVEELHGTVCIQICIAYQQGKGCDLFYNLNFIKEKAGVQL